jgi:hypothetical protein
LPAQIGEPLLGNLDLDIVLGMNPHETPIGAMVEIVPSCAVDGAMKLDRYSLRAKSPEPAMPF